MLNCNRKKTYLSSLSLSKKLENLPEICKKVRQLNKSAQHVNKVQVMEVRFWIHLSKFIKLILSELS